MVGDSTISAVDTYFTSACVSEGTPGNCTSSDNLIKAAGLKTENVSSLSATLVNGRYCVTVTAKDGGDYAGLSSTTANGGNCPTN